MASNSWPLPPSISGRQHEAVGARRRGAAGGGGDLGRRLERGRRHFEGDAVVHRRLFEILFAVQQLQQCEQQQPRRLAGVALADGRWLRAPARPVRRRRPPPARSRARAARSARRQQRAQPSGVSCVHAAEFEAQHRCPARPGRAGAPGCGAMAASSMPAERLRSASRRRRPGRPRRPAAAGSRPAARFRSWLA